jgi:hypothetical protein
MNAAPNKRDDKSSTQEKILHLKDIGEFENSRIGNEIVSKLLKIKCKLIFEIGANGVVNTRIVDNKGLDFCTSDDFKRTFAVGRILRDVLDKTGKGGPAETVLRRIANNSAKGGLSHGYILPGNKGQAGTLANHYDSLIKMEDCLVNLEKIFSSNPLVVDFRSLVNRMKEVLGASHLELKSTRERTLLKDIYPSLMKKHGVPTWFLDKIKDSKNFIQVMNSHKPSRLFFLSKGKDGISLTTKEWDNAEIFKALPNVLKNSKFMKDLIEKISARQEDYIKAILPYQPSANDEAILEITAWPVVPAFIDIDDFLDQKSRKKICELVPWGSNTYKSCLERLNTGLIRVIFLEVSRIEDTGPFWSAVMGNSDINAKIEPGVLIWDLLKEEENYDEKINNFWNFGTKEHWKVFKDVFAGSLTAFCGGAIELGVAELFEDLESNYNILKVVTMDSTEMTESVKIADTKEGDRTPDEVEKLREYQTRTASYKAITNSLKPNFTLPSPKIVPTEYWSDQSTHSLIPNLSDSETTNADKLFAEMLGIKMTEQDERILPNNPIDDKVIAYLNLPGNQASLKIIDAVAKTRLSKLIASFYQEELQMDVASTVIGTIKRFKEGIAEDGLAEQSVQASF